MDYASIDDLVVDSTFNRRLRAAAVRASSASSGKMEADDLVQEAWLEITRAWPRLNPDQRHHGFIFVIAQRAMIKRSSRAKERPASLVESHAPQIVARGGSMGAFVVDAPDAELDAFSGVCHAFGSLFSGMTARFAANCRIAVGSAAAALRQALRTIVRPPAQAPHEKLFCAVDVGVQQVRGLAATYGHDVSGLAQFVLSAEVSGVCAFISSDGEFGVIDNAGNGTQLLVQSGRSAAGGGQIGREQGCAVFSGGAEDTPRGADQGNSVSFRPACEPDQKRQQVCARAAGYDGAPDCTLFNSRGSEYGNATDRAAEGTLAGSSAVSRSEPGALRLRDEQSGECRSIRMSMVTRTTLTARGNLADAAVAVAPSSPAAAIAKALAKVKDVAAVRAAVLAHARVAQVFQRWLNARGEPIDDVIVADTKRMGAQVVIQTEADFPRALGCFGRAAAVKWDLDSLPCVTACPHGPTHFIGQNGVSPVAAPETSGQYLTGMAQDGAPGTGVPAVDYRPYYLQQAGKDGGGQPKLQYTSSGAVILRSGACPATMALFDALSIPPSPWGSVNHWLSAVLPEVIEEVLAAAPKEAWTAGTPVSGKDAAIGVPVTPTPKDVEGKIANPPAPAEAAQGSGSLDLTTVAGVRNWLCGGGFVTERAFDGVVSRASADPDPTKVKKLLNMAKTRKLMAANGAVVYPTWLAWARGVSGDAELRSMLVASPGWKRFAEQHADENAAIAALSSADTGGVPFDGPQHSTAEPEDTDAVYPVAPEYDREVLDLLKALYASVEHTRTIMEALQCRVKFTSDPAPSAGAKSAAKGGAPAPASGSASSTPMTAPASSAQPALSPVPNHAPQSGASNTMPSPHTGFGTPPGAPPLPKNL